MDVSLFYDGTAGLVRSLSVAPILYVAVIAFIRISGKRSTSQMNNFDWVVTVAMGSLMASGILLKDITILESAGSIGLLLLLQWVLTWSIIRAPWVAKLVRAEPALLYHHGAFLQKALRRERVSEYEVLAAVRENGIADLGDVQSVILEADASLSVIAKSDERVARPATQDVQGLSAESLS